MALLDQLYRPSLALLTDLYELTMAHGYWKLGRAGREAVFHLYFRKIPFDGGYAIAAGLEDAIAWLRRLRFDRADVDYLATLTGSDDKPLFDPAFLDYLLTLEFACDVDAIPEGTAVFANEPLVRVRGPLLQAQIVETALLTILNFQTLIATKAARICQAAQGEPVLEFGLRRAQGIDGGVTASRAAFVGGCSATSNVLAGRLLGIPVRGTHAHSWIMSFSTEAEAFEACADAMPNNCIFLVDTYDTLNGVRLAAEAGRKLKARGHKMLGVRLDSGDLAYLSIEARKILDDAGLHDAAIVGTNDLDERTIESLKQQGAKINVWAVGTRLVTAQDQPALGGVYKLSAVREDDGSWRYPLKASETLGKASFPGILQTRRYSRSGMFTADMIYHEPDGVPPAPVIVDPKDPTRRRAIDPSSAGQDLMVPVFRGGRCVYECPPLPSVRRRTAEQLSRLHPAIKRLLNPHEYPVGPEQSLADRRTAALLAARPQKMPAADP
jgi:nicotinate phosphoribosyltransferase